MITFEVMGSVPDYRSPESSLLYSPAEYSFLVAEPPQGEVGSVLVNDLELHVDMNGVVLYVDGYAPSLGWVAVQLDPPQGTLVSVRARIGQTIEPGVSYRLVAPHDWPIVFDPENGWICCGQPTVADEAQICMIRPDTVLVIESGLLTAVWLCPASLPGD